MPVGLEKKLVQLSAKVEEEEFLEVAKRIGQMITCTHE